MLLILFPNQLLCDATVGDGKAFVSGVLTPFVRMSAKRCLRD